MEKYVNYSDSDEFKNSNILVCDDFEMTLSDIEGTIRRTAPDVVFVDYLGLIKPTIKGSEYEQMNEISRGLKKLAGNLQVPVFALHQLSRKIFERDNKEPMMSDLRGSGHLEQDADFVFFVHRPAYFDPKLNPHEFKFFVGKSRHTGGGKYFTLSYDAKTQTITDPAGDTPEPYQQLDFKGVKNAEIIKNLPFMKQFDLDKFHEAKMMQTNPKFMYLYTFKNFEYALGLQSKSKIQNPSFDDRTYIELCEIYPKLKYAFKEYGKTKSSGYGPDVFRIKSTNNANGNQFGE